MRLLPHLFMKLAPFFVTQDDNTPGATPDGYAPFFVTNLAGTFLVNGAEKDELQ